jgi:hypothetical protein
MEALNNKEKSKKVWQFLGVFAGLILVPFALVFFSYYKLPQALIAEDQSKLEKFSRYLDMQKRLFKNISSIDGKLQKNLLVTDPNMKKEENAKIANLVQELKNIDSSDLILVVAKLAEGSVIRNENSEELGKKFKKEEMKTESAKVKAEQAKAAAAGAAAGALPPLMGAEGYKDPEQSSQAPSESGIPTRETTR